MTARENLHYTYRCMELLRLEYNSKQETLPPSEFKNLCVDTLDPKMLRVGVMQCEAIDEVVKECGYEIGSDDYMLELGSAQAAATDTTYDSLIDIEAL